MKRSDVIAGLHNGWVTTMSRDKKIIWVWGKKKLMGKIDTKTGKWETFPRGT